MARKRADVALAPSKGKLNLSLDVHVLRRLSAYAGFRGETMSAVVARAVQAEMRGFRVGLASDPAPAIVDPPKLADVG